MKLATPERSHQQPLDHVEARFMTPAGQPGEQWMLQAVLINKGPVPARNVITAISTNADEENYELPKPSKYDAPGFIPQNGGALFLPTTLTKQEAVAKLRERGGYFLHVTAWFKGIDKHKFKVKGLAVLQYDEGRAMGWSVIGIEAD